MQIEQFDTGLKGQKNIKKLVITPEENYNNKQKVKHYLKTTLHSGKLKIEENLKEFFSEDVMVKCFYPLNEFSGITKFKENFWLPLFEAFPDIERREQVLIGGTFADKMQIGSISTLSGIFKKPWLGIKPNFKMVNLKCCEIHELKNDKIVETHILIDVIDLIFQTGIYPINPSRGAEGNWLSPINADGVNFYEKNPKISKLSLEQSLIMQRSLNIKPELDNPSDEELRMKLIDHPQKEYWHEKMIWYGPSGVGTARSLEGFVAHHQLPFRKTFFDRKKLQTEDFDKKFKDVINLINLNAPVKIIIRNKKDEEIILLFEEIIKEIGRIELKKKIEILENKVSLNLNENLYTELLSLRNQLKEG